MRNIAVNLLRRVAQNQNATRSVHTSPCNFINPKWRKERGLPESLNQHGPLTDRPDYTFMDGRVTPIGVRHRRRIDLQREMAQKIVTSCDELAFAKERYVRLNAEHEATRQQLINEKLKPKGALLLEKKKKKM